MSIDYTIKSLEQFSLELLKHKEMHYAVGTSFYFDTVRKNRVKTTHVKCTCGRVWVLDDYYIDFKKIENLIIEFNKISEDDISILSALNDKEVFDEMYADEYGTISSLEV